MAGTVFEARRAQRNLSPGARYPVPVSEPISPPERYRCACCGFLTLPDPSPGSLEICHVCRWQDDMVGFTEPESAVGPNAVSLNEARANYKRLGVSDPARAGRARAPRPDEAPPAE